MSFSAFSQFTDRLLLHRRFTLRRARHSSAARFVSALLQTGSTRINCTKCLIRRCRALQRAKELRNTVMLRLRKLTHMCSRTLSDPANRFRKTRKKKSSVVPLFRSCHMSAICARLGSKGKAGVPSFLPTAVGTASSPRRAPRRSRRSGGESPAEVQRKTLRPVRANTLAQFASPAQPVQKKEPHRQAEPACGSSYAPVNQCRKAPSSTAIKIFKKICVTLLQNTRK